MSLHIVVDAQHGSSGKGKLAPWLAARLRVRAVSAANYPNAGHTYVDDDGVAYVCKVLPAGMFAADEMLVLLSPASGIRLPDLEREMAWALDRRATVLVHERAAIVTAEHAAAEQSGAFSTRHIASTMQGAGRAYAEKVGRGAAVALAADYRVQLSNMGAQVVSGAEFRQRTRDALRGGVLHEVAQGHGLSIDHGSSYPHCTFRNCSTASALDALAVPYAAVGEVWLAARPFPIRVGNVEGGTSGGVYPDQTEITWADVAASAGMPHDEAEKLLDKELTTVTKRLRRVFTFSMTGYADAAWTSGATHAMLNFAQYLDWNANGVRRWSELPQRVLHLVERMESVGPRVHVVGTGPRLSDAASRY